MKSKLLKIALAGALLATPVLRASDHDDGENDKKARSLNLTDLYVFKESSHAAGGSNDHLVFIMNSNPRSLPQQQYFFSTNARYDFRISRVGTNNGAAVTANNDIILRFEFSAPNATSKKQNITLTVYKDGQKTVKSVIDAGGAIETTPLAGAASPISNNITIDGQTLNVFAGLREDPFFFDVIGFFKFRSGTGTFSGADFTKDYNVNSIVVKVPIAFLQKSGETVFDTWTTISVPQAN